MKQPTPAAWKKALLAYETGFNALMLETLQPHEREALLIVHDLLRMRASGANDV